MAGLIDWSLWQAPPDLGALYQQGQQRGRAQRQQQVTDQALGLLGSNPEEAQRLLMTVDPATGLKLQESQRAAARDQREVAQFDRQERDAAYDRRMKVYGGLGEFGRGVKNDADLAALKADPYFQDAYTQAQTQLGTNVPMEALTLGQLQRFNQIGQKLQIAQLGGGGLAAVDPETGDMRILREPDKPIILGNGQMALDPVTRQPIYNNPKTFAPQRAPSGGQGAVATGRKPWERNW